MLVNDYVGDVRIKVEGTILKPATIDWIDFPNAASA